MPLDPDTEIQYRKGGKIMKKMPRKFSAGGVPPADVDAAKQDARVKREREAYEKARPTMLGPRPTEKPSEKPPVAKKKGGKVKKFEGGDMVTLDTRERRADERKEPAPIVNLTSPASSTPAAPAAESDADKAIKAAKADDIPSFAEASSYGAQAAQDAPQGIKGGEHVVKPVTNTAPKAAAPKRVAPKAAPKKVAPKLKPGNDVEPYARREEQTEPQIGRYKKKEEAPKRTGATGSYEEKGPEKDFERAGKTWEAAKALGRRMLTTPSGYYVGENRFAKGGGVEAKGKTKGKIVKMAKGGSVRGYGISKVTNKTKYV